MTRVGDGRLRARRMSGTTERLATNEGVWRRLVVALDRCAIALMCQATKPMAKMCHEGISR
jgi:hypothetical protein